MSSESHQDAGAHRVERKLPPPFPYSMRYPEPDPSDPFAPLSVLRDRTATLTNSPYESPVAIPDSTPASSRMLDLAAFVVHQRSKSTALGFPSAESGWQGHASQLRKGASMGLRVNEYAPGTEAPAATMTSTTLGPSATETQRHEARRRSQSVFALRSGTFSFLDSRAVPGPQHNAESSTRRHSLSPYGSRASVATSSSTSSGNSTRRERRTSGASARPRSCSSSFVSATLLDGVSEQLDGAVPLRKDMHVMQVDIPATRGDEKCSEGLPRALPPPPLDKRSPSVSSTGSWSRDLPFYSATSRPQTPTESEPESVERDGGRFARLRARKSIALQTRRSSTSSSLRSTLRAAAEAADKLAAEDASLPAPPEVTLPPKVAQKLVVVPENTRTTSLTAGTSPRSNELEEYPRVGPQTGGWGAVLSRSAHSGCCKCYTALSSKGRGEGRASVCTLTSQTIDIAGFLHGMPGRSSSTPLPLSRPLPSPPTVTTHPEPMVKLSPTPLPYVLEPHYTRSSSAPCCTYAYSTGPAYYPPSTSITDEQPSVTAASHSNDANAITYGPCFGLKYHAGDFKLSSS
ncbi:hypothetical protein BC826DRAFT_1110104 [Russula brevipes]|nr:hypothetical protein BC826DRAFT_1110104 [Russula brevipes]